MTRTSALGWVARAARRAAAGSTRAAPAEAPHFRIRPAVASRGYADQAELKKTPLYDFHVENGGKMVPFAGWSMPIQYKDSIMEATTHCRTKGSLFDVSHMCGLSLKGKDVIPYIESLVVGDIAGLEPGTGTLSVFTNDAGGIIDDTVVTKVNDEHIYMVVNAGCREKDLGHMEKHLKPFQASGKDVGWHIHDERSLLAVQGPLAAPTLQKLTKADVSQIFFGEFRFLDVNGSQTFVTRTGYTGEDGFEISVPNEDAVALAKAFMEKSEGGIRLCGLGPRDSLRLEAGLCLYGHDLEQHISPVEAGLSWTIGKKRRAAGDFPGAETILQQLKDGPTKRRIGLLVGPGAPAREHTEILNADGEAIGEVSSGGYSPNLKKNIAMGYVQSGHHKKGTPVKVAVRGRTNESVITKMPFVPTTYYKKP